METTQDISNGAQVKVTWISPWAGWYVFYAVIFAERYWLLESGLELRFPNSSF